MKRICKICGAEFNVYPAYVKRGQGIYCSVNCQRVGKSEEMKNLPKEKNKYIENKHPTVKPLKLMSYLITMGSREGDVILDPFAGSGTTLEAARLLNRQFVGIDLSEENKPLMEARGQLNRQTLESF